MNDTKISNNSDNIYFESIGAEFDLISYAFLLINLIIFPFYKYLYEINRDRDKKMLLFPTVQHFYEMVQLAYFLFVFSIILHTLLHVIHEIVIIRFLIVVIFYALCFTMYHLTKAFYLTTFFLAFQQFLVFYFPKLEKQVSIIQKHFFKDVWYLYIIFLITEAILWVLSNGSTAAEAKFDTFSSATIIIPYVLQLFSTLFYIPIMRSVRKNAYVTSGHYYILQKYIFWQAVTALIFESFPIIFSTIQLLHGSCGCSFVVIATLVSTLITPLTIQVPYLGSRKWIGDSSEKISLKRFIKVILGIKSFSVNPHINDQ
ncbi:Serpentine Receptor, class Z [Caenorhabditis elegans]|uniref:Serpentine Receptor, class Z n=1 Tax=Caenorhabditis elegans TaxID=6239 RepID=Q6A587_CAEEL|nr:Serpentine Receptor, class Z [Caenorhabditis elegans]CCD64027.1 Serpentine Receptor, class Z [Caenorhabditis elegans]|eukprot:NP_001021314.1 Serpentine Receptor, class Z [Caenorhabditis elegans]